MPRLGDPDGPAGTYLPLSAAKRWRVSSVVRAKFGANVSQTKWQTWDRSISGGIDGPMFEPPVDANHCAITLSMLAGKNECSARSWSSARAHSSTAHRICPTGAMAVVHRERTDGTASAQRP